MKIKFVMAFVALVLSQTISSQDFTYKHAGQTLTYTVVDDTEKICQLKGYSGKEVDGSLEIPQTVSYDGQIYEVNSIGDAAFASCLQLTDVTIPNSVTTIGERAFMLCGNLKNVTIPNSVTIIGERAFTGCGELTEMIIPGTVTIIGDYAFGGCSKLTSIDMPDGVVSIGVSTFYNCSSLSNVAMGESVTTIGNNAFYGCSSLVSVDIPDSVISIGDSAFEFCTGLISIDIPNSVTSIGRLAFSCCSGLKSIRIGQAATAIGEQAFVGCDNIVSVYCLSVNPVESSDVIFVQAYGNATLYVPAIAIDKYRTTAPWRNFVKIEPFDFSGIHVLESDIHYDVAVDIYNLKGEKIAKQINELTPGIYIVRQGYEYVKIFVN